MNTTTIGLIGIILISIYSIYGLYYSCDTTFGHGYSWEKEQENGNTVSYEKCRKCGDEKGHHYYGTGESIKFEIYSLTAPFGILYGNIHGSIHGSSGFIGGYIGGSISTDLEEAYIVKFMDDDKLTTITFDANKTPLIVDGELYLEYHPKYRFEKNKNGEWIQKPYPWVQYKTEVYSIHIAELPEIDLKLSTNYKEKRLMK